MLCPSHQCCSSSHHSRSPLYQWVTNLFFQDYLLIPNLAESMVPWILVMKRSDSLWGKREAPIALPMANIDLRGREEGEGQEGRGAVLAWGSLIACCCQQGLCLALFLLFLCSVCCLTRWLLHKHGQMNESNSCLGCSFSP